MSPESTGDNTATPPRPLRTQCQGHLETVPAAGGTPRVERRETELQWPPRPPPTAGVSDGSDRRKGRTVSSHSNCRRHGRNSLRLSSLLTNPKAFGLKTRCPPENRSLPRAASRDAHRQRSLAGKALPTDPPVPPEPQSPQLAVQVWAQRRDKPALSWSARLRPTADSRLSWASKATQN